MKNPKEPVKDAKRNDKRGSKLVWHEKIALAVILMFLISGALLAVRMYAERSDADVVFVGGVAFVTLLVYMLATLLSKLMQK